MPLVINSLKGGHTQTCTHTYRRPDQKILRNQGHAGLWSAHTWFKNNKDNKISGQERLCT